MAQIPIQLPYFPIRSLPQNPHQVAKDFTLHGGYVATCIHFWSYFLPTQIISFVSEYNFSPSCYRFIALLLLILFIFSIQNNDEQEKKERQLSRLQQQMQSRNFSSPSATPGDRRKSLSSVAGLTNQQLSEHYSKCIQLSAENVRTTSLYIVRFRCLKSVE